MGPWSCSLAAQLGDLDGDGKVTILDLVILNGYLNGQITLTSGQMQAADLNQNGFITQTDADLLANAILGAAPQPARNPCIFLAVDGTGDYGPQTPGTQTAGWQEALNYCVAHRRDLYVKGGFGGNAVFNISNTIRFPAAKPLPAALVRKIVKARLAENAKGK